MMMNIDRGEYLNSSFDMIHSNKKNNVYCLHQNVHLSTTTEKKNFDWIDQQKPSLHLKNL
jgi:hypothetical protein